MFYIADSRDIFISLPRAFCATRGGGGGGGGGGETIRMKKEKKNDYTGLPKESVSPNVAFVRGLKVSLHEKVRSGLKCCIWHKEATWTTIACFRGILKKANILGDSCPLSIKTTDVPYLTDSYTGSTTLLMRGDVIMSSEGPQSTSGYRLSGTSTL